MTLDATPVPGLPSVASAVASLVASRSAARGDVTVLCTVHIERKKLDIEKQARPETRATQSTCVLNLRECDTPRVHLSLPPHATRISRFQNHSWLRFTGHREGGKRKQSTLLLRFTVYRERNHRNSYSFSYGYGSSDLKNIMYGFQSFTSKTALSSRAATSTRHRSESQVHTSLTLPARRDTSRREGSHGSPIRTPRTEFQTRAHRTYNT